jgi:Fe-S oxidoreductase
MGYVPENIKAIRDELTAAADWQVSGKADILYFADPYSVEAGTDKVFDAVMKKAGIAYASITGQGCIGRALKVLGFAEDAKAVMTKFAALINESGAKTVVVSNPAAYQALKVDAAEWGIAVNADVMHTSEYFLALNFNSKAGKLYYIESDYLRNYNELTFPHDLLAKLGAEEQHLGASHDFLDVPDQQESFSCGEGAVVLPRIDARLVEKLAKRVEEQVDDPANDRIVTASPYTKLCLERYTSLKVETLEEVVLKAL